MIRIAKLFCIAMVFCALAPAAQTSAAPAQAGYVLVTENGSNTVAKIDWCTDEIIGRATVGDTPSAMAVDHQRRWVYVAVNSFRGVVVLDPDTMTVTNMTVTGMGQKPIGIALTPDNQTLLVTTRGNDGFASSDDTLAIVNLNTTTWPPTGTLAANIYTGAHPIDVVVGRDGRHAVVTVRNEPDILIVDIPTRSILMRDITLPGDAEPEGSDAHPLTNIVYVTLHGPASAIEVVDLDTTSFVGRVSIAHDPVAHPSTGVFTPDGTKFYVAGQSVNDVFMFSCTNPANPVQDMSVTLPVGQQPHFIAFFPGGDKAYVADTMSPGPNQKGDFSVINNYTGTPSIAGQVLTNLVTGPLRFAYLLPQPAISGIVQQDTNVEVTVGTGTGLTYRMWSLDEYLTGNTNWQMVAEYLAATNADTVFTDAGQNGRLHPSAVTNRFYRASVFWK